MLIISSTKEADGRYHVERRSEERASFGFAEILEVVEEINLYLPDDWRMTSGAGSFAIYVDAGVKFKFIGESYRLASGSMLHIINSIFYPDFHHASKHPRQYGISPDVHIDFRVKKENRDLSAANLYFFRPAVDNFKSPLFARQYEKVKQSKGVKTGDEYHRIHPLTKDGLDIEHFLWVRWDANRGLVDPVETPENDYRGDSFWKLSKIDEAKAKKLVEGYNSLLKSFTIKRLTEPRATRAYEIEYKFLLTTLNRQEAETTFALIKTLVGEEGFYIEGSPFQKKQTDVYFDDDALSLHAAGASFRMRSAKGSKVVTLKKRLPIPGIGNDGYYERIEEEAFITASDEKRLLNGLGLNLLPYRLISYIVPNCGTLKKRVHIENSRTKLIIRDSAANKAEICLDEINYGIGSGKFGPFYEIEIESKGIERDVLCNLAMKIERGFGLMPARQSKYERGLSLGKTRVRGSGRKKVIIDTDCGVDDALALALAMKSDELDVLAVTTVAGNTSVDQATTNVMRVFNVLGIANIPLIAKGAGSPLKKKLQTVPDVHGVDGLGNTGGYKLPSWYDTRIDKRPAWQVIADLAEKHKKEIILITIGPMTNLALAIRLYPEKVRHLKEVVSMGGVFFNAGNIAPDAEFNIYCDPSAAARAVEFCKQSCLDIPRKKDGSEDLSGVVPLTFVGLDVTHQVMLRRGMLHRLHEGNPQNKLLKFVRDISSKYMEFYKEKTGIDGCYLHDPLAVGYVINPSFLEIEKHIIDVETRGQFTSGMIFPDDRPTRNEKRRDQIQKVINIARRVEKEAFEEFFLSRIALS